MTGHELVIASSNNAAVQNVSDEIPAATVVEPNLLGDLDYFSEIATSLVNESDVIDSSTRPAWGQSHPNCSDGRDTVGWCRASEAHRSRLKACTKCSATLARSLKQELGSIPSGAEKSRPTKAPGDEARDVWNTWRRQRRRRLSLRLSRGR